MRDTLDHSLSKTGKCFDSFLAKYKKTSAKEKLHGKELYQFIIHHGFISVF